MKRMLEVGTSIQNHLQQTILISVSHEAKSLKEEKNQKGIKKEKKRMHNEPIP